MFGLAMDNKLVRSFIQAEVNKSSRTCLMEIDYTQINEFESVVLQSMYYAKTFVLINFKEIKYMPPTAVLKEVLEFSKKNSISIIFMVDSPDIFKRVNGAINLAGGKCTEITVRSINSAILRTILVDMYKQSTGKTLPPVLQQKLIDRLRRTVKVDALLETAMNQRNLTALKETLLYRQKVYSGNFASSIILGNQSCNTSIYVEQNLTRIPYIFAILENFVADTLYIYPQYLSGEFNRATLSDYKTGATKGKFNKYGADPKLYLEVLEKKSYEYLYILNRRLKAADTRTKRIILLGEMLL